MSAEHDRETQEVEEVVKRVAKILVHKDGTQVDLLDVIADFTVATMILAKQFWVGDDYLDSLFNFAKSLEISIARPPDPKKDN